MKLLTEMVLIEAVQSYAADHTQWVVSVNWNMMDD